MKKLLSVITIVLLLCPSCKKEGTTSCSANCVTINVSGRLYNEINNIGLKDEPISIKWNHRGFCFFCPTLNVYKGTTGTNGFFNFDITVDSTLFYNNALYLNAPINPDYTYPGEILERRLYTKDDTDFKNVNFGVYPKAQLIIRLHRISNDNFLYYEIAHKYTQNNEINDLLLQGQQFAKDTIIKVNTSANIYTKIISNKLISISNTEVHEDSIICIKGGANTIDIYY